MEKYQCKNVASGHSKENFSRHALLQWLNSLLNLNIEKIEDLCSGVVYCQIMDMLFPGCISLKKVKSDASTTTDFWNNFKQLQNAFRAVGCEKDVSIDSLIKGRFQENFEFLQWFKKFHDVNESQVSTVSSKTSSASAARGYTRPTGITQATSQTQQEVNIKCQIAAAKEKMDKINQEKDFYLNKLRNIEIICTGDDVVEDDKETLISKILAELYATEEGYLPPDVEII